MKRNLILAALLAVSATAVQAEGLGKPCTTEPESKWLKIDAIEKIVTEHGYKVAKSKMKNSCVEVYARDKDGKRVELFIDPATGNMVGQAN